MRYCNDSPDNGPLLWLARDCRFGKLPHLSPSLSMAQKPTSVRQGPRDRGLKNSRIFEISSRDRTGLSLWSIRGLEYTYRIHHGLERRPSHRAYFTSDAGVCSRPSGDVCRVNPL